MNIYHNRNTSYEDLIRILKFCNIKDCFYYFENWDDTQLGRGIEDEKAIISHEYIVIFNQSLEIKIKKYNQSYHVVVMSDEVNEGFNGVLYGPETVEPFEESRKHKMYLWGEHDKGLYDSFSKKSWKNKYQNIFYEAKIPRLLTYPVEAPEGTHKAYISYRIFQSGGKFLYKYDYVSAC